MKRFFQPMTKASQGGVALIAVLWLVSAMGLIVTGVVQAVRSEARTVGVQRQVVTGSALGDAAILLALQNQNALAAEPLAAIQRIPVQFEGVAYSVEVWPMNGLIDLNNAPLLLLADMYRFGGELSADASRAMAQSTLDTRQQKDATGVIERFDAKEDLLRVPGMTYDLYAKVHSLVTAELKEGSGRVNALAAPSGVLRILSGGNVDRAAVLESRRNTDPSAMDTTFLQPEHFAMVPSRSLLFQVQIELPDGSALVRSWHVYRGADPRSGLPWRVLAKEHSMKLPA